MSYEPALGPQSRFYTEDDLRNGPPPGSRPIVRHPDGSYQELADWVRGRGRKIAMPGSGEGYHIEEVSPGRRWNAYAPGTTPDPHGWDWTPSVGHLLTETINGKPTVQNISVHPDHQRRGVAKAMWEAAGRPLHIPGAQTDEGKAWADQVGGENLWWEGNEHLRESSYRVAMPRQDAYDLITHEEGYAKEPPVVGEMDQTPVRPGPWYHSSPHELEPGTVLDPRQPNNYSYWQEHLTPRDRWVFMHHDPAKTETYGDHLYEVKPMGEGPYAYGGEDAANDFGNGYASPKARVIREIVRNRPQESIDLADAMSRMAASVPDWERQLIRQNTATDVNGAVHTLDWGGSRGYNHGEQSSGLLPTCSCGWSSAAGSEAAGRRGFTQHIKSIGREGRVAAVPGEIHRGLNLDMDTASPQLRKILTDYGPESPEFITELLRNGTGTYWSRDKGFAEGVNPGNGLQVAMSADWDGNGAQQLHPELTRKLPDSWGDMSLLAPAENAVSEFNIKPGKELNVKSIRVRNKGEPSWREVLRQPVRARTARICEGMPMRDAWDAEYKREDWPWDYKTDAERDVVPDGFHQGPWHHATDQNYEVGDVIEPNKGYFPSRFNRYYEQSGHGDRQNWVWVDTPESIRNQWGSGGEHNVYEVEPLDEGPWPFNGGDVMGYVTPRVRVKRRVLQKTAPPPRWQSPIDMNQRLIGPRPPDPNDKPAYEPALPRAASVHEAMSASEAYDPGMYDPDFDDGPSFWEEQGAGDDTVGPWWHSAGERYEPGDIIMPNKGYFPSGYNDMYDENGMGGRQNWVWMDRPSNTRNTWGQPDDYTYEVEPLDEGPHPWNGEGNEGYVAPRARVKRVITEPSGPPNPAFDLPSAHRQRLIGPQPPPVNIDKAAMMLAMTPIPILAAAAVKEMSWEH